MPHLVHAAKADALNGAALARRQRRVERHGARPLEHPQRYRHHHGIGSKAALVCLHLNACVGPGARGFSLRAAA